MCSYNPIAVQVIYWSMTDDLSATVRYSFLSITGNSELYIVAQILKSAVISMIFVDQISISFAISRAM